MRKAIVLLSGGLDSAVTLYLAKKKALRCYCLIFDYGQRHKREIESAKKIAQEAHCPAQVIKIKLARKGSALLDKNREIRQYPGLRGNAADAGIPSTYVPGRNIIFLSFALSFAESIGAQAIFIGAHSQDYSGYPDCRPEFYRAFGKAAKLGTRAGVEGKTIRIITPLINKNKDEIIKSGESLKVPFQLTWSCYRGGRRPCGRCDSCYFRAKGFREAGIDDPVYQR